MLVNDCEQVKYDKQKDIEGRNELERRVGEMFGKIPSTAQGNELLAAENIE
jgi:hypothetical protein